MSNYFAHVMIGNCSIPIMCSCRFKSTFVCLQISGVSRLVWEHSLELLSFESIRHCVSCSALLASSPLFYMRSEHTNSYAQIAYYYSQHSCLITIVKYYTSNNMTTPHIFPLVLWTFPFSTCIHFIIINVNYALCTCWGNVLMITQVANKILL